MRPHPFPMWREYKLFEHWHADIIQYPMGHTVDGIALAPREEQE
jgi:hypothetical protein